jgi:anti-sigma regulatory factor (Ser/Thr protein kinase)
MVEQMPLAAAPDSPQLARRFVSERINAWGYSHLTQVVELLTSEVVTNAVVHARAPFVVELEDQGDGVLVAVEDPDTALPRRIDASPSSIGGRGLVIISALATDWGVDPVPGRGKRVWFKVADGPSRDPADG